MKESRGPGGGRARKKGVWVIVSHNGGCVITRVDRVKIGAMPISLHWQQIAADVVRTAARRREREGRERTRKRERTEQFRVLAGVSVRREHGNPECHVIVELNTPAYTHVVPTSKELGAYCTHLIRHSCTFDRLLARQIRSGGLLENLRGRGEGRGIRTQRESTRALRASSSRVLATRFSEPRPPFSIVASHFLPELLARFYARSSMPRRRGCAKHVDRGVRDRRTVCARIPTRCQ